MVSVGVVSVEVGDMNLIQGISLRGHHGIDLVGLVEIVIEVISLTVLPQSLTITIIPVLTSLTKTVPSSSPSNPIPPLILSFPINPPLSFLFLPTEHPFPLPITKLFLLSLLIPLHIIEPFLQLPDPELLFDKLPLQRVLLVSWTGLEGLYVLGVDLTVDLDVS